MESIKRILDLDVCVCQGKTKKWIQRKFQKWWMPFTFLKKGVVYEKS